MKATKSDIERRTFSQKSDVPDTNSSMYFFVLLKLSLLVSHEALIILQRATKRTHPGKSLTVYLK